MPDLIDLIAEAMTEERRRYTIYRHKTDDARDRLIDLEDDHSILFDGDWKACEAHLERLVADHVVAVLREKGWELKPPPEPAPDDPYRAREDSDGWHAEMYFHVKGGAQWVPLNRKGNWADPECYSTGIISVRHPFQERVDAERAVERGRRINAGRAMIAAGDAK